MPIYRYKCLNCNLQFELKQGFNEESVVTCPECQNQACRLFYAAPVIFKGAGFYTTDSREQKESKLSDQVKKEDKD